MKHEKEVMEKVTDLRSEYNKTKSFDSANQLNGICDKMIAVSENYPDLKANEQFLNLQKNFLESYLQEIKS